MVNHHTVHTRPVAIVISRGANGASIGSPLFPSHRSDGKGSSDTIKDVGRSQRNKLLERRSKDTETGTITPETAMSPSRPKKM